MAAAMDDTKVEVGAELIRSLRRVGQHRITPACPSCGGPVATIGIPKLAYTFDVCSCDVVDYDHLVETIYHRACLPQTECATYVPWRSGRTSDCQICGRPESAHTKDDPSCV